MTDFHYSASGLSLILLISFLFMGCVSEPVKINWPANHPANPKTQEAEFIRPQNPFESNMAVMKKEPDKDLMLKHTMPNEGGMQHMDHNMGTDTKKHMDSELKMKPEYPEDHTRHQEHHQ
ncbi:MAG: hypothetical protein PVI00_13250 [Desulfobacterales bacterium]|jgi:PBP1b-binding outer membrane lipoprotein LpoB